MYAFLISDVVASWDTSKISKGSKDTTSFTFCVWPHKCTMYDHNATMIESLNNVNLLTLFDNFFESFFAFFNFSSSSDTIQYWIFKLSWFFSGKLESMKFFSGNNMFLKTDIVKGTATQNKIVVRKKNQAPSS